MPHYAQDIISNNENISDLQKEVKFLEEVYNKKLDDIISKKEALYEDQVQVIKSKNSLILLNDLPLTNEDNIKMIDEIKIIFDESKSLDTETLSQNINLIEDIKENLLSGNSEIANENIEVFFKNVLNLENEIDSNLTSVISEEIIQINNKINDISTLITENSNLDEIELINSIIDDSKIKKEKLNSRILFVDDNLFGLINSEKNNLINKIELLIDIESNLSEPPKMTANKQIKQLEDEINQLNENLSNKKLELQKSNKELIKNYKLLDALYNAPRYGEYLITLEGNLVPFNNEEEIIKNKISTLEENNQELEKTTSLLNLNIETKDIQIKQIYDEATELEKEISIQNTKIKRIELENENLINLQELTDQQINENSVNLINKYNEMEKINSEARWGKYVLSENGKIVLYTTLENEIKNEILVLENKNKELNLKKDQLNNSIFSIQEKNCF